MAKYPRLLRSLRQKPAYPERTGRAMAGPYVDDVDARIELAASHGVHPISSETYDNSVGRVVCRDADGNEFAFGGLPVDA